MCFSMPSMPKPPAMPTPPAPAPPPPPIKQTLEVTPEKKKKRTERQSLKIDRLPGSANTTGSTGLQIPK